jgi:cytidine deaminase
MKYDELISSALRVRKNAYARYSKYRVGSAVMGAGGEISCGCNVENASYGLTICAERSAIFSLVALGGSKVIAIAVATADGSSPCGACLQVLSEFADDDCVVLLIDDEGACKETRLVDLFPNRFRFEPS